MTQVSLHQAVLCEQPDFMIFMQSHMYSPLSLDAAPSSETPATNGTPAAKKANNGRRKSATSVPEHKKKTPAKGKKKAPEMRLNAQAGDMYMVAMRGYQPWPVIICDEEMLPESLLSKRPVSAKRIDGTYREDFLEGGKNAKDRRYPVMFLGTNELYVFSNATALASPLTTSQCMASEHGTTRVRHRRCEEGCRVRQPGKEE